MAEPKQPAHDENEMDDPAITNALQSLKAASKLTTVQNKPATTLKRFFSALYNSLFFFAKCTVESSFP